MRRAIWLIVILTVAGLVGGLCADTTQRQTAREYLGGMADVREAVTAGDTQEAAARYAPWQARWQRDKDWLNCLISHHHTRAVSLSMRQLDTALAHGWRDEALRALDELEDALGDIETGDSPLWENIL